MPEVLADLYQDTGDERYLPSRDRGPVRRFIRDFVDSRFSFIELMVPLLVVSMVLGYSGNPTMMNLSNTILFTTLLVIVFDIVMLRFRLLRLGDDLLLEVLRHFFVVRVLHVEAAAALRERAQRRRVLEHLGERHLAGDGADAARLADHLLDQTAAARQVADHGAEELLGRMTGDRVNGC